MKLTGLIFIIALLGACGDGGAYPPSPPFESSSDTQSDSPSNQPTPSQSGSGVLLNKPYPIEWATADGLRAFLDIPLGNDQFAIEPYWSCYIRSEGPLNFRFHPGVASGQSGRVEMAGTAYIFEHTLDQDFVLSGSMDYNIVGADSAVFNNQAWEFSEYKQSIFRVGEFANTVSVSRRATVRMDGVQANCGMRCTNTQGNCQIPREDFAAWLVEGTAL